MGIQLYADDFVELLGPTDRSGDSPDTPITSALSCTARLYDDRKDVAVASIERIVTAEAAAGQKVLQVESTANLASGEQLTVFYSDGSVELEVIDTVDSATQLTLTEDLTTSVSAGAVIRRGYYATGATVFYTLEKHSFEIGQTAEIRQGDTSLHTSTISQIGPDWIKISSGITYAVAAGARIARKIGGDITMSIFNASLAAANTDDWGYRGTIMDTHSAEMVVGMQIRVEITLIDSGVGNPVMRKIFRTPVEGDG